MRTPLFRSPSHRDGLQLLAVANVIADEPASTYSELVVVGSEHSLFLTFGVADRKLVLANERAWAACCQSFDKLNQWTVLAAVAMPDHLHLLAAPKDRDASVAQFSKWFKRWFSAAFCDCRPSVSDGGPMNWQWQEGCFDRLLR